MWQTLWHLVSKQFENQFLAGGVVTVLLTATLAVLRNVPLRLLGLAKRYLITSVDLADHDQAFYWVQEWLAQQPYTQKRATLLTAATRRSANGKSPAILGNESAEPTLSVAFSPAPGVHLFRYRRHWILLERDRRSGDTVSDVTYRETFTLKAFSRQVLLDLILEAQKASQPQDGCIVVTQSGRYGLMGPRRVPSRPIDTVITSNDVGGHISRDIQWFLGAEQWFAHRGIPYQRGYLLYGPPGNGKTSLITALASELKLPVYAISLSGMDDSTLREAMSGVAPKSLVILEDIDRITLRGGNEGGEDAERVTMAGFLNALDGVGAPHGRILFLTANHPDKLDRAIIRPGRVDLQVEFKNADADMARRLFLRFFDDTGLADKLAAQIAASPREYSMAELQEHMIEHREYPALAADLTLIKPRL